MALHTLDVTPYVTLIGELIQERKSGTQTVIQGGVRRTLYWAHGELVLAASSLPEESLGAFLLGRAVVPREVGSQLAPSDPTGIVPLFHDAGIVELANKQTLLREWTLALAIPLFSLGEGAAAFTEQEPLEPEKRVFLQSMPAFVVRGVRSISNGLVIRRALGDMKRILGPSPESRWDIQMLPLSDIERQVASSLVEPRVLETFLKQYAAESLLAARVVISMLTLGVFSVLEERPAAGARGDPSAERDLALLATISADDTRSFRALAIARQLPRMDHYQLLELPRGATRAQVAHRLDEIRARFDPATYPAGVRDAVTDILKRVDVAATILEHPARRKEYDALLASARRDELDFSMDQRITRRNIAEKNFARARDLIVEGDYYGAIVLLREAVRFAPEHAESWYLLGTCQERNPRWQRDAVESFQQALSADPNYVDAMLSLGDLYRAQGLTSRARSCYEDVLQVNADNPEAKRRLKGL